VGLVAVEQPVTVSGIEIRPGDPVCADADGVVVVPAAAVGQVVEIAERVERVEAGIVAAVRAGGTLRDARQQLGYHELQRRQA
jgi:regulator of RNase E activity RraA